MPTGDAGLAVTFSACTFVFLRVARRAVRASARVAGGLPYAPVWTPV